MTGKTERDGSWLPISQADRSIATVQTFPEVSVALRNSHPVWVRDEDGRIYEAVWSEGHANYWWDLEGESPVDPVEFCPHPCDPRFTAAAVNERSTLLALVQEMGKALKQANEALDAEPEYHHSGMGCGLEDRNIHDRYQAMEHGWDCALERAFDEQIDPAKSILAAALASFTAFMEGQDNG